MAVTAEAQADKAAVKKLLIARFNEDGRPLSPAALDLLVAKMFYVPRDQREAEIQRIVANLVVGADLTVSAKEIQDAMGDEAHQTASATEPIQVIDAFSVPQPMWDATRKRFYLDATPHTLLPDALAKVQVVLGRLQMIHQRLLRSDTFHARILRLPDDPDGSSRATVQLTAIKALLGSTASSSVVLGMLRRDAHGKCVLDDASGSIGVDLREVPADDVCGFIAEGSCLLVEGNQQPDGSFLAHSILQPPLEQATAAVASLYGLSLFGNEALGPEEVLRIADDDFQIECQRITFIAECHLDDALTLARLGAIFQGYEDLDEGPPAIIVLMGPFFSRPGPSNQPTHTEMRLEFRALASLLTNFPTLQSKSQLVLVPGPGDPGSCGVLPQPPLLRSIAAPLLRSPCRVSLATNPCRIQFYTKQIVVFAEARTQKFQAHTVLRPQGNWSTETMFEHSCRTMLSQSHLSPFPLASTPVWWQHDHALMLFPQPDALVLSDRGPACQVIVDGVQCINAGQLAGGTFAALLPEVPASEAESASERGRVELCEVPDLEDAAESDGDSASREDFGYGGEADDRPGVAAKAASAEREESGDDFNASGSEDEAQDGAANEADISIEAAGTPASDEDALSAGGGTDADDGDSMDEGDKGNSI